MNRWPAPVPYEFSLSRVAVHILPGLQPVDKGAEKLHICVLLGAYGLLKGVFQSPALWGISTLTKLQHFPTMLMKCAVVAVS